MTGTKRVRYARIERIVERLIDSSQQAGPPVAVEAMVRNHGITLRKGDLGEVSGLLARTRDVTTIGVNSCQSRVRQRFTIAHEFGHFLLHEGIFEHVDHGYRINPAGGSTELARVNFRSHVSSQATDVEEMEANYFAATLLMPVRFLNEKSAILAVDDDREVKRLAGMFDVSAHAMSLRLSNVYRKYAPY